MARDWVMVAAEAAALTAACEVGSLVALRVAVAVATVVAPTVVVATAASAGAAAVAMAAVAMAAAVEAVCTRGCHPHTRPGMSVTAG